MGSEYSSTIAAFVQELEARRPLPPLVPRNDWDSGLTERIQGVSVDELFDGQTVKDELFGASVKSGLLLWNDALDVSHKISQNIDSPTGSYWHGIMHRREPDYSNAKYWFRRAGDHAIFAELREQVLALLEARSRQSPELADYTAAIQQKTDWDAFQFVDWCQDAASAPDENVVKFLKAAQVEEINLLLDYSYRRALA